MKYKYMGYNSLAQKVSGTIEAAGTEDAQSKLREMHIRPLQLVTEKTSPAKTNQSAKSASSSFEWQSLLGMGLSAKPDLVTFTAFIRQLATLQGSGTPIVQALGMLADQSNNRGFASVLNDVQQQIQEGMSLAL